MTDAEINALLDANQTEADRQRNHAEEKHREAKASVSFKQALKAEISKNANPNNEKYQICREVASESPTVQLAAYAMLHPTFDILLCLLLFVLVIRIHMHNLTRRKIPHISLTTDTNKERTLLNTVKRSLFNCYNFFDRATRKEFWISLIIIILALGFALFIWWDAYDDFVFLPILAIFLLCAVPFVAIIVRRNHDFGRKTIWSLCNVIFGIGLLFAYNCFVDKIFSNSSCTREIRNILYLFTVLLYLFFIGILKGDPHKNKYGDHLN